MNRDQIEGNWKQAKGLLRAKWGMLTDDDVDVIAGDREMLLGKIQERYGLDTEEAQNQVAEFARRWQSDAAGTSEVAIEGDPIDTATLKIGMKF